MLLEVKNLWKRIGKFSIEDISLKLEGGELTLLLGPNGSGKTMLCRLLCLLLKPDKGEILLDGVNVWDIEDEYKSKLSYVAENEGYPFWLTLEEYMKFFTGLMGLSWDDIRNKVRELCRELLLLNKWNERLAEFSVEMLRKVSLIRGLIKGEIFIWDEPFINLDQKAMRFICKKLNELKSENKIVFVTSHLLPPYLIPDKVCIIDNGRMKVVLRGTKALGLREVIMRFKFPVDNVQYYLTNRLKLIVVEKLESNVLRVLVTSDLLLELLGEANYLKEKFGLLDIEVRRFFEFK